jgi:hypothetical protein
MKPSSKIYGLGLSVNLPLAGLASLPAAEVADVRVCLGQEPPWFDDQGSGAVGQRYVSADCEGGKPALRVLERKGGACFEMRYADGTKVFIDRTGSNVWATWPDTATLEDTATYILGPVLGFVLRLRGVLCLHASAVAVGDRAVALVGPPGAGKSSTAACFAAIGYPVLAEDVVALTEQEGGFLVQPGYPRVNLWPESVAALFDFTEALPLITPPWEKRFLDLSTGSSRFQSEPLPLSAVYLLGERQSPPAAPRIESMSAADGLISLAANTYANYLLDTAMRAQEFDALSRLVAAVPVRRVLPVEDLKGLKGLCEAIVGDARHV